MNKQTQKQVRQERPKNEPKLVAQIMEEMGIFPYGRPLYTLKMKKA